MSREHDKIQDNIMRMIERLKIYEAEIEYPDKTLQGRRIDVVAIRKSDRTTFIGIEIHLEGELDPDLKKLVNSQFPYKVIITNDRELISTGKKMSDQIYWFPVPSENERGFEDFLRKISDVDEKTPYFFDTNRQLMELVGKSQRVMKIKELLTQNNLSIELAWKIIYYGSAGGYSSGVTDEYRGASEYTYLKSLGIIDGLEIYRDYMKWGDQLRFTDERVEYPGGGESRKMGSQLMNFKAWKDYLKEIIQDYVNSKLDDLLAVSKEYSDVFNEIAFIGKEGIFSNTQNSPSYSYNAGIENVLEFDMGYTPPVDVARLKALASNSYLSGQFWEYGNKLAGAELAVMVEGRLIMTLYKPLADAVRCEGALRRKSDEADEYLSWWILFQGGSGRDMKRYANILDVPWDSVEECVNLTFSLGLTGKYNTDITGFRGVQRAINPFGDPDTLTDIAIFKREEFAEFCKDKMKSAIDKIIK